MAKVLSSCFPLVVLAVLLTVLVSVTKEDIASKWSCSSKVKTGLTKEDIRRFTNAAKVVTKEGVQGSEWSGNAINSKTQKLYKPSKKQLRSKMMATNDGHNGTKAPVKTPVFEEDDVKCLSRKQMWKLMSSRKGMQSHDEIIGMSRELEEEWVHYTELHRRCTEGRNITDWFLRTNYDQEVGRNISGDCRYLLYLDGDEGIGNRLLAVASAWVYAVLTKRVLLIDTRRDLHQLLCEPFQHSTWKLPPDFPYFPLGPTQGSYLNNPTNYNALILYLRHDPSQEDTHFFCDALQHKISNFTWLSWSSNQYLLPNLFIMPTFFPKLVAMFPQPQHIFSHISRMLLYPSNEVWALAVQQYRGFMASSHTNVGLQVRLMRSGMEPVTYDDKVQWMIMDCLHDRGYLPRILWGNDENKSVAASMTMSKNLLNDQKVDIGLQVASLQGRYYENLKEVYTQQIAEDGSSLRVNTLCQLRYQDRSYLQAKLAYVEMLLMSLSDKLATSAGSTLGYVAQSWGAHFPLILDFSEIAFPNCFQKDMPYGSPLFYYCPEQFRDPSYTQNMTLDSFVQASICTRKARSSDPCLHAPHIPPCFQSSQGHPLSSNVFSPQHKAWLEAHLHQCQDLSIAWQLGPPPQNHEHQPILVFPPNQSNNI